MGQVGLVELVGGRRNERGLSAVDTCDAVHISASSYALHSPAAGDGG